MTAPAPTLAPDRAGCRVRPGPGLPGQALPGLGRDAKRCAADSEDPADHAAVGAAYTAFMRAHLARDERDHLALEDEVSRLTAENLRLRGAILTAAAAVDLPRGRRVMAEDTANIILASIGRSRVPGSTSLIRRYDAQARSEDRLADNSPGTT